jgi:hypothetical protein
MIVSSDEWLTASSPLPLLVILGPRASERKLRLYGCACVRRVCHRAHEEAIRRAAEVGERLADGLADEEECRLARLALVDAGEEARRTDIYGKGLVYWTAGWVVGRWMAEEAARALAQEWVWQKAGWSGEAEARASLLRDLFSDPTRPVSFDRAWRAWGEGTVARLARAAYEERLLPGGGLCPDRLAVLADALEDAGCGDGALLGHLRGPGPHVRGCWPVDLCLGLA